MAHGDAYMSTTLRPAPWRIEDQRTRFEELTFDKAIQAIKAAVRIHFPEADFINLDKAAELAAKVHHGRTQSYSGRL